MGALEEVRVVDFGHFVAGPVTGMLLADQGADVIKVDPPGGPRFRSEANATWNRGKRSIELDLRDRDDLAIARRLATGADVVIENFRPDVMDRLGLGEAVLRADNPGLVYAAMPGFGPEDTRSSLPAWEGVVLAAADGFRPAVAYREILQQLHRPPTRRPGAPTFTAEPMASMLAALLSSVGIVAALRTRAVTGSGQRVTVPLFDALLQAAGPYAVTSLPFTPSAEAAVTPWNHQYPCQDGRWIHIACEDRIQIDALFAALNLDEHRGVFGPGTGPVDGRSLADHAAVVPTLNEIFRARPAHEWEALFLATSVPAAVCRTSAEWLRHPPAISGRFLQEVTSEQLGPTVQPTPAVRIGPPPASANPKLTPVPNQHRAELVAEAGAGRAPVDRTTTMISAIDGPLAGIRVIDFGIGVAGPVCGRTLAEFGAEVIKVDDPTSGPIADHQDINRGKRSVELELEDDVAYERILDLIATADVVIENFPPGDAEDLGLDYATLREENPGLVHASITTFGPDGPLAPAFGSGETADAMTGMQVRYGGSTNPTVWPYPAVTPFGAGYAAAFGVIVGLLNRPATGRGVDVVTSLVSAAALLQSTHLIDHRAKRWDEPSGVDQLGYGPHQRLYQAQDGWLYLGAGSGDELAPLLGSTAESLERDLERWCGARSVSDAVGWLAARGVGAHPLTWINDALSDPVVVRRGLSLVGDHGADNGLVRTVGPGPWLSRSMIGPGRPARPPGGDTTAILAGLPPRPQADAAALRIPGGPIDRRGPQVFEPINPAEGGEGEE